MPRVARRTFRLGSLVVPALLPVVAAAADVPCDVVAAIYARESTESKKDPPGTAFTADTVRAEYFSKSFAGLIARADAKAAKEQEPGPLDFDPVISGQDGEVKQLKVETETTVGDKAVVSARFLSFGHPTKVTYDLIRERDGWRVNDIRGRIDKDAWSVRKIFEDAERRK